MQAFIFVLGFTVVFSGMGLASSFIGQFLTFNRVLLLKAGGVLVVVMGLNLMGLLPLNIFARHWSPLQGFRPPSFLRSFFLGTAFALGWTPCIGPVLASILALAAATGSTTAGGLLMAVYSLGMAIPFLVLCLTIDRNPGLQKMMGKYSRAGLLVSGFLLVILGGFYFLDLAGKAGQKTGEKPRQETGERPAQGTQGAAVAPDFTLVTWKEKRSA